MHADHIQSWFMDIVLLWIIIGYLVIAFQFFIKSSMSSSNKAKTALLQLVGIFVFCAFAGYVPRLIEIPSPILVGTHIILVVVTWLYIVFGNIDKLAEVVDNSSTDED